MFLQCLEGHRREVNQLYHTIIRDKRHRDPAILLFEEISRRDFSEWSMGYLGYTPENRALFLRYSAETTFDPYSMSADSLKQFFKDVGPSAKWFE